MRFMVHRPRHDRRWPLHPLPPITAKLIADAARGKLPAAPLFARWGCAWRKDGWMKAIKKAVAAADDLSPQTIREAA